MKTTGDCKGTTDMMRLIVRTHKSCCWCLIKETIVNRGTQRPNVSKYARSVSDGFHHPLEACLVNFGAALKTIYLFGCFTRGTLDETKVLGGFFVSSENVSYPYGSGRKSEDKKQPCFHYKIIGDILSLFRTF